MLSCLLSSAWYASTTADTNQLSLWQPQLLTAHDTDRLQPVGTPCSFVLLQMINGCAEHLLFFRDELLDFCSNGSQWRCNTGDVGRAQEQV